MVNFSDADVGKPDPTDTIDIDDVVDRLDNLVGGLIGTTSLAAVDIDGGSIDGTIIGGTTKAAGSFTTLVATGTAQITGASTFSAAVVASSTLGVTGVSTFSGAVVASSTLGVTGASTFSAAVVASSTLNVTGTTTFSGAVVASSTLSVASTLGVTGTTTFSGAVVASSTLAVSGAGSCLSLNLAGGGAFKVKLYSAAINGDSGTTNIAHGLGRGNIIGMLVPTASESEYLVDSYIIGDTDILVGWARISSAPACTLFVTLFHTTP